MIIHSKEFCLVCLSHCVWSTNLKTRRHRPEMGWCAAPQKTEPAPLTEICTGLTQFDAKARTADVVKLGHDRFLPHPSHFIIHHTTTRLYNRRYWECHYI